VGGSRRPTADVGGGRRPAPLASAGLADDGGAVGDELGQPAALAESVRIEADADERLERERVLDHRAQAVAVSQEETMAAMTMTTMYAMPSPMPIQPKMMPAIAIPRPPWVPPDSSIWRRAMYPNTNARIAPTRQTKIGAIPSTSDAMARPFVFGPVW